MGELKGNKKLKLIDRKILSVNEAKNYAKLPIIPNISLEY
jgi:hypothetical protein